MAIATTSPRAGLASREPSRALSLLEGRSVLGRPLQMVLTDAWGRSKCFRHATTDGSAVDHALHGLWVAIALDLHAGGCAVELCQVL